MKNVLTIIGLVGLLALTLTVRTFAAPTPQPQSAQLGANAMQIMIATPTVGQVLQPTAALPGTVVPQGPNQITTPVPNAQGMGMGMHGKMMGGMMGGMRGQMGMRGGMRGGMNGGAAMQWQMDMSGTGGFSMNHEMMFGVTPMHDDVAMQLGMTTQDLYNHMASGKSMVQIAAEKGITEQQLMDNIMAGRRAAYSQAVKDGHMTQPQADAMLQSLNNNLKTMVNGQGTGASGWSMMWDTQPNTQTTP